ncbi:MAG: enoyl-CoA hydratase-related protein [Cruoricaptor ignavus]|nr:enoyl-CoA hydratase-related protein [Cruoricaptor ignavus]MDO5615607.1 enoyl-CoA hydratase-related protein [Cruoricaptor ignavus]
MNNILIEKEQQTTIITINRPQSLNALNAETIKELSTALDDCASDKNCRAIILTGSGEKSFVAGADIKEFSDFNTEKAEELARNGQNSLFNKIENLNKPVIAAVNGFALGGGLELAMSCHIRYASENAKLGLPEVTLGLIPGYGGTQRLPKLVGKGWANELVFSAKMISASKAKEIGLVNEVFSLEELLLKTKELASAIAKNSPMGIERAIKAINLSDTEKGFDYEIKAFGELFELDDKKEGVAAFMEKRKPNF